MEKERIIDYQKRFSNLHLILLLLVAVLMIEHGVFANSCGIIKPLVVCALLIFVECFQKAKKYFCSTQVMMVYRYCQLIGISILLIVDINVYLDAIAYVFFLLLSVEFILNFDLSDKYYQYFSLTLVIAPAIVLQIYRAITYTKENVILSSMICVVIVFLILLYVVRLYVDVTDRLESKYLEQLRYIEDANAMNQQLVENQGKVKKANEQLAYQKVQLEFAYKKINNVNTEILLQNQILKLISAHHDVERLMSLIVATIRTQMNVDTFAIILYPNAILSKSQMYQIRTSHGMKYQKFLGERIEAGDYDEFIHGNKTYVDNHVEPQRYPFVRNTEVASFMIIPLVKVDEVIGGLYIADSKYDAFTDNVAFFEATVSSINIAVENCNLYARLEEMAIKDELTGIYNRRYLNQICERFIFEALRDKTPLSVALFDIDKFKNINDSYGHLFGDDALKIVAKMASELAERVNGVAGRYGGEEFVVLFPNRSLTATYELVKEYHDNIRVTKFYHGMDEVKIRLSVGISSFPETCLNPSDLLNYADWAMYYSKENGRDRITIDTSTIREQARMK